MCDTAVPQLSGTLCTALNWTEALIWLKEHLPKPFPLVLFLNLDQFSSLAPVLIELTEKKKKQTGGWGVKRWESKKNLNLILLLWSLSHELSAVRHHTGTTMKLSNLSSLCCSRSDLRGISVLPWPLGGCQPVVRGMWWVLGKEWRRCWKKWYFKWENQWEPSKHPPF